MATFREKLTDQWQDAINFLLGVFLFFSPWLLGYAGETAAAWNAYILGVIIAVDAAVAFMAFQGWEEWLNVLFGAWLVISPWLLGFTGVAAAMWTAIIVGLAVLILAIWSAQTEHKLVTRA